MPAIKELRHPYVTKKKGMQGGRAIIAGTRISVSAIVIWYKNGKEIYEILEMYPQLSPSQIHDALSYYYDHRDEIEAEILLSQDEAYWQGKYPPSKGVANPAVMQ